MQFIELSRKYMEKRDQWYKPNLLYNIHYRTPKKVESPKLIVQTSLFNPSVCTCGEHGCEPKYRMERRVLWSNKEIERVEQQEKTDEEQKTAESTDLRDKEYARSDGSNGDVEHSEASCDKKQRMHEKKGTKYNTDGGFQSCFDAKVAYVGDEKFSTDGDSSPCIDDCTDRGHSVGCDNMKMETDGVGRSNGDGSARSNREVDLGDRNSKSDDVGKRNSGGCVKSDSEIGVRDVIKTDGVGRSNDAGSDSRVDFDERKIPASDVGRSNEGGKDIGDGKVCFGEGTIKRDNLGNKSNYRVRNESEIGIADEKATKNGVEKKINNDSSARGDGKNSIDRISTDNVGGRFVSHCSNRSDGRSGVIDEKINVNTVKSQDNDNIIEEKISKSQDSDSGCFTLGDGGGIVDERNRTDDIGQCEDKGCVRVDGVGGAADEEGYLGGVASQCKDDDEIITNGDGYVDAAYVCQNYDVEIEEPDEGISAAFGIMSVYCNSELHSWRTIQKEDNVETPSKEKEQL